MKGYSVDIIIASIAFSIMLVVVIANVLNRLIFAQSFGFTQEISFICFVYTVFFGMIYLFKTHALISIDVIVEKLPVKFKRVTNIVYFVILIIANLYLTYLSLELALDGFVRPTSFLGIPYAYIYLPALISF